MDVTGFCGKHSVGVKRMVSVWTCSGVAGVLYPLALPIGGVTTGRHAGLDHKAHDKLYILGCIRRGPSTGVAPDWDPPLQPAAPAATGVAQAFDVLGWDGSTSGRGEPPEDIREEKEAHANPRVCNRGRRV